jgi:hypothetical protein
MHSMCSQLCDQGHQLHGTSSQHESVSLPSGGSVGKGYIMVNYYKA